MHKTIYSCRTYKNAIVSFVNSTSAYIILHVEPHQTLELIRVILRMGGMRPDVLTQMTCTEIIIHSVPSPFL